MIKVSDYKVELSEYKVVKPIIEKWHYSHSVRGLHASYCFGLFAAEQAKKMLLRHSERRSQVMKVAEGPRENRTCSKMCTRAPFSPSQILSAFPISRALWPVFGLL